MSDNKDFSPVLYDVMRELATQLGGRYVEWMDEATSAANPADEEHWRAKHARVTRDVRTVDPDSRQAIDAHTARLREELEAMPGPDSPGSPGGANPHASTDPAAGSDLTADQLRARFGNRVLPYLEDLRPDAHTTGSWPPVLVYMGGQPGAGKSRAIERAAQARPSLVPVVGDDLRQFHPHYPHLMRTDPVSMPEVTAQASGPWINMSAQYLREQRADVLIETTLRSPDAMAGTIADFRQAGYLVELRVVAVPHEVSRLSTVERYTGQVDAVGAGRWTPGAAHDEAYAQAVATIERLVASRQIDRFVVEDRAGVVVCEQSYFGARDEELVLASREASAALERARSVQQLTPEDARAWLELARVQIDSVRGLAQSNPDLLETVRVVGSADAQAVAARAYPRDPGRARAAAEALSSLLN